MQCSVMTRLAAAATLAGGVLAMLSAVVAASAAPGTVLIDVAVDSPVAASFSDDLALELFATQGGADAGGGCTLDEEQSPSGSTYQAHWTCAVPLASYELGIAGVPIGHEVTASCLPPVTERIGDGKGGFVTVELSAPFPRQECAIEIVYREGRLVVDGSVTNDDGGTASVTDVQVEVFEATGGVRIGTASVCAADGTCLDTLLPIGDYVLGYIGPDGYVRTVTQTVEPLTGERIDDDPDARFTVAADSVVHLALAIDDPEPGATTTSTTTSTLAPTTTAAPVAGTLPATGAAQRTAVTSALAALLVLAGAALLATRRRPS